MALTTAPGLNHQTLQTFSSKHIVQVIVTVSEHCDCNRNGHCKWKVTQDGQYCSKYVGPIDVSERGQQNIGSIDKETPQRDLVDRHSKNLVGAKVSSVDSSHVSPSHTREVQRYYELQTAR